MAWAHLHTLRVGFCCSPARAAQPSPAPSEDGTNGQEARAHWALWAPGDHPPGGVSAGDRRMKCHPQ